MAFSEREELDLNGELEVLAGDQTIFENLLISVDKMEYQGFDPIVLLNHLKAKARQGDRDFRKDVMTMAVIGTLRGSQMVKMRQKSTQEMCQVLDKMVKVYGLTSETPKTNTTVTLVRVAACMARVISRGLHTGQLSIRTTVDPASVCEGYPEAMSISTFGSLIPMPGEGSISAVDSELMFSAYCYHQYRFDETINSKATRHKTTIETIRNYARIQQHSSLYPNSVRLIHCKTVGLIEKRKNIFLLVPQVSTVLLKAKEKWDGLEKA